MASECYGAGHIGSGRRECPLQIQLWSRAAAGRPPENWFKVPEFASDEEGPGFSNARPLPMVASAAFIVESRMKFLGPDNLYREIRGANLGSVCLVCGEGEREVKGFLAGVK